MSAGWAAWLAERHVQETPAQKLARQAAQGAERQERGELAAEAKRAAELEDERDARALRAQQAGLTGHSLGDVFTEASRAADEDAAYCEALKTIDKIDRRRARRAEAQRSEAEQLAAVAQRSATVTGGPDLLAPAKRAMAEAAREDDILRRARRVATRSRPFGSGPGEVNGTAVRRGDRAATHSLRLETHEELKALPRGASSRGGCPPCDDCGFVICRCGQNPGALRSGAYSEPLGQMVSRVTEGAMVSVR